MATRQHSAGRLTYLRCALRHFLQDLWDEWRSGLTQYAAILLAVVLGVLATFVVIETSGGQSCGSAGQKACKPHQAKMSRHDHRVLGRRKQLGIIKRVM